MNLPTTATDHENCSFVTPGPPGAGKTLLARSLPSNMPNLTLDFLDELPEFDARSLEVMRQPLEDKVVTISRVNGTLTFPANFMLVAATPALLRTQCGASVNPCPCGYHGDPVKECTCSLTQVLRYQKKISGPLLDRIDIHIEVPRVEYDKLTGDRLGEPSARIRERVERARERQRRRFAGTPLQCNGDMGPAEVREYGVLDDAGKGLMRSAMP